MVAPAVAAALALLAAGPAATPPGPADAVLAAQRDLRAAAAPGATRASIAHAAAQWFDYEELARRSLGPLWGKQTPADRSRLVTALRELLEAKYLPGVVSRSSAQLRIGRVTRSGRDATVEATGREDGREFPLTFRMHRRPDGRWMAYDAAVAGLGLLDGYEQRFPQLIEIGGMDRLVASLEEERRAAAAR